MNLDYLPKVQQLFETFFDHKPNRGVTSPDLRRAIESYAANLSAGRQEAPIFPPELEAYVRKVTLYAYKVTDEDIASLKELNYTEDDLFEITISAALGAGRTRLECGLAALMKTVISDQ